MSIANPSTPLEQFFHNLWGGVKSVAQTEQGRIAMQVEVFLKDPEALVLALSHLEPLFTLSKGQLATAYRYVGEALMRRSQEIEASRDKIE